MTVRGLGRVTNEAEIAEVVVATRAGGTVAMHPKCASQLQLHPGQHAARVVAGLLIHSYVRLQQQSPGFVSEHIVTASFNLLSDRYRNDEPRALRSEAAQSARCFG